MKLNQLVYGVAASALFLTGCATEQSRSVEVSKVVAASTTYQGNAARSRWVNSTTVRATCAAFLPKVRDRLGGQAKSVLVTHLQQSGRFNVLDRENMSETQQEAAIKKQTQNLKGADYVVTGSIAEFGRKEVGDQQLFGILGRGKEQIAYAKVNLNIVNVSTSEVVYSTQGAGEYSLSNREVVGFGGTASYDSTLNGKVLDLAIREAVDNLVKGVDSGAWKPAG